MNQQTRRRLEEDERAKAHGIGEISRSLAGVLAASAHASKTNQGADIVVVHDSGRGLVITTKGYPAAAPAKRSREEYTFVSDTAQKLAPAELLGNADISTGGQVAAYIRAASARHASVLAQILPNVLSSIESAQVEVDEARLREQVKALETLLPEVAPTFDPRLERVGEALRLQNAFMKRETVLTSADLAKRAGFSRRNPSHTASRWRKAGKIFSVTYRGKDYFPSFQFADDGQPLPLVLPLLATLRTGDTMTEWDIALWFTTPNGWLSGQVPKDLLIERNKETVARLQRAAEQEVTADND